MVNQKITFKEKLFNVRMTTAPISKDIANNFFKSKYFDVNKLLEAIDTALVENRILLTQPIIDNKVYSILEDLDSDERKESFLELKEDTKPQDKGSEITYYRRYTLQSLLGLIAEDDDGNKANGNAKQPQSKPQEKELPWLNKDSESYNKVITAIKNGKVKSLEEIKKHFKLSKEVSAELLKEFEQTI